MTEEQLCSEGITRSLRFHAGRFYRLLLGVGSIPAGVYRCESILNSEIYFSLGDDRCTQFSLSDIKSSQITEVSFKLGKLHAMRRDEFFSWYFQHTLPLAASLPAYKVFLLQK